MALSKLVIGLIAGVISVGAIGGITAGVVTSNSRNTVNTVEEEKTENSEDKKSSMAESRNRRDVKDEKSIDFSKEGDEKSEAISGSEPTDKRSKMNDSLSSRLEKAKQDTERDAARRKEKEAKKAQEKMRGQEGTRTEGDADGKTKPLSPTTTTTTTSTLQRTGGEDSNPAGMGAGEKGLVREDEPAEVVVQGEGY